MKTHHLFLTVLTLLISNNIVKSQPDEPIVILTKEIEKKNQEINNLENTKTILSDSLEVQNKTIIDLKIQIDDLTTSVEDFKNINKELENTIASNNKNNTNHKRRIKEISDSLSSLIEIEAKKNELEFENKDLKQGLIESKDSIFTLTEIIADLETENEKLNKSKLKEDIKKLTEAIEQLQQENNRQKEEIVRLSELETEYNLLKDEKNKLDNNYASLIADKLNIEKGRDELQKEKEKLETSLKTFVGFQDDAINSVNNELPTLIEGKKFYDVNNEIQYFQEKINTIKSVGNQNNSNLIALEAKLIEFKKTVEVFEKSNAVLNKQYSSLDVETSIQALESLHNNHNKFYEAEKARLLRLLKNYCKAYKESYAFTNELATDEKIVLEYIGYFKDFTIEDITSTQKKVFINVYQNFPFIKKKIDDREKSPTNSEISIPSVNSTCE